MKNEIVLPDVTLLTLLYVAAIETEYPLISEVAK